MFLAMARRISHYPDQLTCLHNCGRSPVYEAEQKEKPGERWPDIYAPIADHLGISKIKTELDDLSLKYRNQGFVYELAEKVALKLGGGSVRTGLIF